jgi:hypothetical protein
MRKTSILLAFLALPLLAQTPPAFRTPRVSQHAVLKQTVGLTDVTIDYSRPAVKGRQIWGALVPYDKVWRTGANEATIISFSDDVTINGQALPRGSYSLHTIPGKDEWTLIFNKVDKQWGSFSYDAAQDALRVKAKPEKGNFKEFLTFDVPQLSYDSATVTIRWENLSVPFTVGTSTTARVVADARAAVAAAKPDDWRTPRIAAGFANDIGMQKEAAEWIDQSVKANANISNLYLKAQIQAKAGDRAGAIKTAEAAIAKAADKDKELVEEIKKSIAGWR